MRKLIWTAAASVAAMLWAVQAQAAPLPPGSDIPATVTPNTLGAQLATTGAQSFSLPGTTGKVTEWVYRDKVTGDLDFVYQFTVTGLTHGHIEHLTAFDYTNVNILDAGYIVDSASHVAPIDINRNGGGDTPSFNFAPPNGVIKGQTSDLLVLKTTASKFDNNGFIGLIDGGGTTKLGFEPIVPEPSSLALLCAAAFGMGGYAWRRRKLSLKQA